MQLTGQGASLTGRELLVLQLLGRGYTVGQIAGALMVSLQEVEALIAQATTQLGAGNYLEAIDVARRRQLILSGV